MARGRCIAALPRRLAANPYCELLYDAVERIGVEVVEGESGLRWLWRRRREVDVLHLHWPERHFRAGRTRSALGLALRLLVARALGYRLVWTVHNQHPHEPEPLGGRVVRAVLARLATLIVHCEAGRRALGGPGRDAIVIPHGSYVGRYPSAVLRGAARARLGIEPDARVLLTFGQIRPYKGLDALARAFATVPDPDARLVVAGQVIGRERQAATVLAAGDPRVRLYLGRIPDDEVQLFLNGADVMVLPYRDVLTSGAAMLAFSFGRGVLAPRLGCFADLQDSGAVLLYDPASPDGLARGLRDALMADPVRLGAAARRLVRGLSWDAIARRHLAAYGLAPALTVLRPPGDTPPVRPAAHR